MDGLQAPVYKVQAAAIDLYMLCEAWSEKQVAVPRVVTSVSDMKLMTGLSC